MANTTLDNPFLSTKNKLDYIIENPIETEEITKEHLLSMINILRAPWFELSQMTPCTVRSKDLVENIKTKIQYLTDSIEIDIPSERIHFYGLIMDLSGIIGSCILIMRQENIAHKSKVHTEQVV